MSAEKDALEMPSMIALECILDPEGNQGRAFEDDFMLMEGGPLAGKRCGVAFWPPPVEVRWTDPEKVVYTYDRTSFSQITDEQRDKMTHVCRGAAYGFRSAHSGSSDA